MFSSLRSIVAAATLTAAMLAGSGQARAEWLKAESPRFQVYSSGSEAELREYVEQLETMESLLRALHGLNMREAPPRRLEIYLARNLREIQRVRPSAEETLGGFYAAGPDIIFAITNQNRERNVRASVRDDKDYVVLHEYVHHFMMQHFPFAYPSWVVEGYAEYFMTARFEKDAVLVGHPMRATASGARDMPLSRLLTESPWNLDTPELREAFYAQSWLLTHYLISDASRRNMLRAYLKDVAEGADSVPAMEKATGMTLAQMQGELRGYRLPITRYPTTSIPRGETVITRLPRAADDLLLESVRLRWYSDRAKDEDLLRTIRTRAARHAGDDFSRLILARAEIRMGDRGTGEQLLQDVLSRETNNVEALQLMAASRMERAKDDEETSSELNAEARSYLARAYAADPNHFPTLVSIARNSGGRTMPAPDNAAEAYLAALEIAPQVIPLRFETAAMLFSRGQTDYGAHVLEPLLNTPHSPQTARAARALLESARAGGPSGSTPEDEPGDEDPAEDAAPAAGGR